jgi:hypothetical protein
LLDFFCLNPFPFSRYTQHGPCLCATPPKARLRRSRTPGPRLLSSWSCDGLPVEHCTRAKRRGASPRLTNETRGATVRRHCSLYDTPRLGDVVQASPPQSGSAPVRRKEDKTGYAKTSACFPEKRACCLVGRPLLTPKRHSPASSVAFLSALLSKAVRSSPRGRARSVCKSWCAGGSRRIGGSLCTTQEESAIQSNIKLMEVHSTAGITFLTIWISGDSRNSCDSVIHEIISLFLYISRISRSCCFIGIGSWQIHSPQTVAGSCAQSRLPFDP